MTAGWMGCGLPDSYFLQPPAVGIQASPGTPIFGITGTDRGSDTSATFKGYELYYKFFGSINDTTFNSDSTSFGTGSTYTDLQQAGFHRLCLGTSHYGLTADTSAGFASAPLIDISQIDSGNIGDSYKVRIRLNDLGTPEPPAVAYDPPNQIASLSYYVYEPPGGPPATKWEEIRRFVTLPTGAGCKPFASNSIAGSLFSGNPANYDTSSDADLYGTVLQDALASATHTILVMVYALSYGKSIVDGTPIYSSPVYLGYAEARILP